MAKKLPEFVYVRRYVDRDGDTYLEVTEDPKSFAEVGESVPAGQYKFDGSVEITSSIEVR